MILMYHISDFVFAGHVCAVLKSLFSFVF